MPRESAIVNRILARANAMPETKALKLHGSPYLERGTPDVHITHRGRSYWIECKVPGEKPTKLQVYRLAQWAEAGAVTAVCTSWEEVEKVLERNSLGAAFVLDDLCTVRVEGAVPKQLNLMDMGNTTVATLIIPK